MRRAATPGRPGRVPLIVFHGDGDATVDHVNAERLVASRAQGGPSDDGRRSRARGPRTTPGASTRGRRTVTAEQWTCTAGHAWSGGSPHGTYTDPQGPDASAEIVRFFLE